MSKLYKILIFGIILAPVLALAQPAVIGAGQPPPNDWLSYAQFLYKFAISVGAVLALIMLIVAGLEMMTASEGMRSDAKDKIQNALIGLLLLLGTYLILNTINPDLLNLRIDTSRLKTDQNQGSQQGSQQDGCFIDPVTNKLKCNIVGPGNNP